MHLVDWSIVGVLFLIVIAIAVYTKRYTLSVADFLSANRCGGRYMLAVTAGVQAFSAVVLLATFEQNYQSGFCGLWWGGVWGIFSLIIAMSGWVAYRFRETRVLTTAQLLEVRYSRKFRVFAGILHWVVGLLGFGFLPGVTARLLIHFCGLPSSVVVFGFEIPMFPLVMLIMLSVDVVLTLAGGQIGIMVTDFLQSQIIQVASAAMIFFVLFKFPWFTILETLKAAPEGKSLIDPLGQANVPDFNVWFFVMYAFLNFYNHMAIPHGQGYNSAPRSPHEAKMARILCSWRATAVNFMLLLIPIAVYVVFNNPQYTSDAETIDGVLNTISDPQVQEQMKVPLALFHFLPIGMVGLFAVIFIMAAITTDDTVLISMGGVLIQDILLPLRRKPLPPKQHLRWLRISIIGIATFAFFFSLVMPIKGYLYMFTYMIASLSMGAAGSVMIGGLYWKRGTTAAAWASTIVGIVLATVGIIAQTAWENITMLTNIAPKCPINGMQIAFYVALSCVVVYILVSWFTCKKPFNLEKMLHRGKYAIEGEHVKAIEKISIFRRLTGIDKEFTFGDKVIAISVICCTLFFILSMVIGTIYGKLYSISYEAWGRWWHGIIFYFAIVTVITVIWFLIGGFKDLIDLFKRLKVVKRDALDDGRVTGHHNLADE